MSCHVMGDTKRPPDRPTMRVGTSNSESYCTCVNSVECQIPGLLQVSLICGTHLEQQQELVTLHIFPPKPSRFQPLLYVSLLFFFPPGLTDQNRRTKSEDAPQVVFSQLHPPLGDLLRRSLSSCPSSRPFLLFFFFFLFFLFFLLRRRPRKSQILDRRARRPSCVGRPI